MIFTVAITDNYLIILCSNAMIKGSTSFYKGGEIAPEIASLLFLHLPLKKKTKNKQNHKTKP